MTDVILETNRLSKDFRGIHGGQRGQFEGRSAGISTR